MEQSRAIESPFEERFLAFVDILGFKTLVDRMDTEIDVFTTIRDALTKVDRQVRLIADRRSTLAERRKETIERGISPMPDPGVNLQMVAFSDCYVLSDRSGGWSVLAAVQLLGSVLIEQGILTRGGVVHGKAYHNDRVLFGPAVIEAHKLESQVANYPRILVAKSALDEAWGYHALHRKELFQQDIDGCWFINVLASPMSKWELLNQVGWEGGSARLDRVRKSLQNQLQRAKTDNKIEHLSKIVWMVHKFNQIATEEGVEPIPVEEM